MALGVVSRAGFHDHIVATDSNVIQNLANGVLLIDRHHLWFSVISNDPQYPLGVVNRGRDVQNNPGDLGQRFSEIVVKVKVSQVNLLLLTVESLARDIALLQLSRVKYAHQGLDVVINRNRGLHDAVCRRFRLEALRSRGGASVNVRLLVSQDRIGLDVCLCPIVLVALVLAFCHEPLGLGSQRHGFGQAGLPEVVHPLGVFAVTHHAELLTLVANNHMTPVNRDNRDVATRENLFLKHLNGSQLTPADFLLDGAASVKNLYFGSG